LCSGDEQRRRLCLTEGTMERYAQEKVENPFTKEDYFHIPPLGRNPMRIGAYFGCEKPSNDWSGVLGPAARGSSRMIQEES